MQYLYVLAGHPLILAFLVILGSLGPLFLQSLASLAGYPLTLTCEQSIASGQALPNPGGHL